MKRTTNLQVAREIRAKYNSGMTQEEIAREYDLAQSTIGRIVRNEVWKEAE
jgi:DNA-binding transcriptional regulator LsrR (DeoR family)